MLSLSQAIKLGRLAEFIAQEEARRIGLVNEAELMDALETTIKQPRSKSQ